MQIHALCMLAARYLHDASSRCTVYTDANDMCYIFFLVQAAVLRMTGVGFTYPGTERQVLRDVNVRCNLNSRVAVLGVRRAQAPHTRRLTMSFCVRRSVSSWVCINGAQSRAWDVF